MELNYLVNKTAFEAFESGDIFFFEIQTKKTISGRVDSLLCKRQGKVIVCDLSEAFGALRL